MALAQSLKVFWTRFAQFAEAMEYDPVDELRQRVEHLEHRIYVKPADAQELDTATLSAPKSDSGLKRVMSHD